MKYLQGPGGHQVADRASADSTCPRLPPHWRGTWIQPETAPPLAGDGPARDTRASESANLRDRALRWVLVAPAIIGVFAVALYPLAYSLYMSFHAYNIISPPGSSGFANYERIITDDRFLNSIQISFTFMLATFTVERVHRVRSGTADQSATSREDDHQVDHPDATMPRPARADGWW